MQFYLLLLLILIDQHLASQSIKKFDKIDTQTFYINSKDSVLRFQASSDIKIKKYSSGLVYYWYKSGSILKTMGGSDGRLLNGEYICFYPDNNLKEKGKFKNGLKDGAWTTWFETGKIKELYHWKKGILNGTHYIYNHDGSISSTEAFKNGNILKEKTKKEHLQILKGRKVDYGSVPENSYPKR